MQKERAGLPSPQEESQIPPVKPGKAGGMNKGAHNTPEDPLLAPLRNKYHVILAVPSRVAQALVLFHRESPFSWQRSEIHADRRLGQTLVSPPAEPSRAGSLPY